MVLTAEEWREVFDERAGILESLGGLPRRVAEDRAWVMVMRELGFPPQGVTLEGCRR